MFLILILIILATFYSIYDKGSLRIISSSIRNIKFYYVIIGVSIIALYFVLQGLYMKKMLNLFHKKISLKRGMLYSMIEFYFSGITPSSTGGQPVQLYYMTKDKIPVKTSYIVLILNTIYFKIVLLVLSIIILIFRSSYVFSNDFVYLMFIFLGFLFDLVIILSGLLLLFNKKVVKKIISVVYKFGKNIKFIKNKIANKDIDTILEKYNSEIEVLKANKKVLWETFFITFIQRLLLFSIAYVVYKALGFSEYSYIDLLTIQITVQVAIEVLPLPGGAWLSENMLYDMFNTIFNVSFANVGMLLTRTFSFYIPLLTCGFIILIYSTIIKRREKRNSGEVND